MLKRRVRAGPQHIPACNGVSRVAGDTEVIAMNDSERKETGTNQVTDVLPPRKPLTPAAQRALAEAAERRAKAEKAAAPDKPRELQGPKAPEPTRYGDWERKGIASDF
jgi:hypothetical protein